ncbi:hypothetical protein CVT24_009915 [Panaeolus cyanescens]|uniref:Uncharacterized protein n=1 Tax=Panaeolus cyanescens TaxID=181874 RepID=A0A409WG28_9AGAR|nr:hypothetical protein CVT24_009915 [Panaeolus cyanescens]
METSILEEALMSMDDLIIFHNHSVIYKLLNGTLCWSPGTYGLHDSSEWSQKLRVCSFSFNVWNSDTRNYEDRQRNPVVLDYGFASACLPSVEPIKEATVHMLNSDNANMRQKDYTQLEYSHNKALEINSEEIRSRLKKRFNDEVDPASPTILLVFDQEMALKCLKRNGVNTERWCIGLRDLIMGEEGRGENQAYRRSPSRQSSSRFPADRRSLSPRRQAPGSHRYSGHLPYRDYGQPSTSHSREHAPVYILDILDLYRRVTGDLKTTHITDAASHFLDASVPKGWCGGIEACLLIDIWRKMISGESIDQQHDIEVNRRHASKPEKQEANEVFDDLDDDEVDPNQIASGPSSFNTSSKPTAMEEESDEGDSDDVSD